MQLKILTRKCGHTLRSLAKGVGTHESYLSQINTGARRPSHALCERIEKFTKGKITRRDLRPDWYDENK